MNVENAKLFVKKKHEGHYRKFGGGSYYDDHLFKVYEILESYGYSDEYLAAGLLHDVVEDTDTEIEDVYELFGSEIGDIVFDLTKTYDSDESGASKALSEVERFKTITNEKSKVVKCADVMANLLFPSPDTPKEFKEGFVKGKKLLIPVLKVKDEIYNDLVLIVNNEVNKL